MLGPQLTDQVWNTVEQLASIWCLFYSVKDYLISIDIVEAFDVDMVFILWCEDVRLGDRRFDTGSREMAFEQVVVIGLQ